MQFVGPSENFRLIAMLWAFITLVWILLGAFTGLWILVLGLAAVSLTASTTCGIAWKKQLRKGQ